MEGRFELSALNRSDVPGVVCHRADISDLDAIGPAFEKVEVVVHMAAFARSGETFEAILNDNVIGTYNVFEASRRAGVKRIVYASSGMAVAGWEQVMPYQVLASGRYDEAPEKWEKLTHQSIPWPRGLYGCSKVWGETLARAFSIYCSQDDIAQIVERCIDAPPELKYDIFYAVSNNRWSYWDLEHAREVIGYVPKDAAEDHRE